MDNPTSSMLNDDINNMDINLAFDNNDLMTSEFFDSVMDIDNCNTGLLSDLKEENYADIIKFDDLLNDVKYDYNSNEETVQSPILKENLSESGSMDSDQFDMIRGSNITLFGNDNSQTLKGDDIYNFLECTPQNISKDLSGLLSVSTPEKTVVRQTNTPKRVIVSKPIITQNNKQKLLPGKKQMIRVQAVGNNGRSLLLPVNVKNMKKIKIISANDLKMENIKVLPATQPQIIKKFTKYATSTSSESVDELDDLDNIGNERSYPPLELTPEEKRLLNKEGIHLPSHYPLSKNEEKELKRIRRKIRNKISAQDSRKRKKEYVDQLEEKARRTDEENELLKKRVKMLNRENTKLSEQLKKLQELLFNSSSKATPTTCLMIVLFSTLLVCVPNLRTAENKDLEVAEQQLGTARRALLFNQPSKEDEEQNLDEFLVFNKDESETRFEEEEKDNGTNAFVKYLGELSMKYENLIKTNCTEILQGGSLQEFCRRHEDDFKMVMQNLKSLMENNENKVEEKKFIEPDISDDEGSIAIVKHRNAYLLDDDDPPTKKVRVSSDIYEKKVVAAVEKSLPMRKE